VLPRGRGIFHNRAMRRRLAEAAKAAACSTKPVSRMSTQVRFLRHLEVRVKGHQIAAANLRRWWFNSTDFMSYAFAPQPVRSSNPISEASEPAGGTSATPNSTGTNSRCDCVDLWQWRSSNGQRGPLAAQVRCFGQPPPPPLSNCVLSLSLQLC
jgi:hypothetical protein